MSQEIKVLVFGGIATLIITLVGIFLLTGSAPSETVVSDPGTLVRDFNHQIATDSARVTLVEFGDFQCPACAGVYPIVEKIRTDYQGRLNFVYRHFPLSQHRHARLAAKAAEAAGSVGDKFWDMYSRLFQGQSEWSESSNPREIFTKYAGSMGLDVEKFTQVMNSEEFTDRINTDIRDGNVLGVDATPTFFINGKKYEGNFSYDAFKSAIEADSD